MSTPVLLAVVGVLGLVTGPLVATTAVRFPWAIREESLVGLPARAGASPPERQNRGGAVALTAVTTMLFVLVALRFGASWQLLPFLFLTVTGVLLAVIDLRHQLLPNRVVLPSIGIGALLLTLPAALESSWPSLLRALLAAVALFAGFLVLALLAPSGLGMGDVKLAALLGLFLGWLGWPAVLVGAVAGFVVQALLAIALLAARRVGRRSELPFGPALLAGTALAIGWADPLVHGYLTATGTA